MYLFDIEKELAKSKYLKLKEDIKKYNYYYYEKNESLISDTEYDFLLKELTQLELKYPELKDEDTPSDKVSGFVNEKFSKVLHKYPMLSLDNTYSIDDIKDFEIRNKKILKIDKNIEYVLELKLDGISISLIYEKGVLVRALTRGDGVYGEDVTENIYQIKSIPKKLKEKIDIEVRGEIVLPISSFNYLNEQRLANSEPLFANPRNAASGTIRQLDAQIVKDRNLDCYLYYLVAPEKYSINTHIDSIKFLEKLGFKTTKVFELYNNFTDLENAINIWDNKRKNLDYETDGLVLKINDLSLYQNLGYTAKSPRWAIAYKFKPDQKLTKIKSIDYQIGRTGVITPVANLEPVSLSGSIVKRATLHNFDEIKRLDIMLYDYVYIQKAAEIIPQVIRVEFSKRDNTQIKLTIPELCPNCNTNIYFDSNLTSIICPNTYCSERIIKSIEYFTSRECMNIKGLGEKINRKLIELGFITNILDLYNLSNFKNEIIKLDKMGEKNITNLLDSIEKSKQNKYETVLYSLGIRFVGKNTASLLCSQFDTIDKLIEADEAKISNIKGIGPKVAKSVREFFDNENNIMIIKGLKELGFNLKTEKKEFNFNENITNYTFLATGTMTNYTRDEIKDLIIKYGGKYLSSVSKNLNYLIVGSNAGSKLKKAMDLNIKIITEDEFLKMVGIE